MDNCIFCKISKGEIEKNFIYQDDLIMAFDDINPVKPIHFLVIPRVHIEDFLHVEDSELFLKIMKSIQMLVKKKELDKKGYRLVVNGGGAQMINHLHFHLVGPMGRHADW